MGLKEFISKCDLKTLVEDKPDISLDAFLDKWKRGEAVLLDVRTKEERELAPLDAFGIHIPLNELPDRLEEIPRDKLVCIVCPGKVRAVMAMCYLVSEGFENVKVLSASHSEVLDRVKPSFVAGLKG